MEKKIRELIAELHRLVKTNNESIDFTKSEVDGAYNKGAADVCSWVSHNLDIILKDPPKNNVIFDGELYVRAEHVAALFKSTIEREAELITTRSADWENIPPINYFIDGQISMLAELRAALAALLELKGKKEKE